MAAAVEALLFVDPYEDFLSEGGKIWPRVKDVAEEAGLIANLKTMDTAAEKPECAFSSSRIAAGSLATTNADATPIPGR